MHLLKAQKNALFDSVKRFGFQPTLFRFDEMAESPTDNSITEIHVSGTPYFFSISTDDEDSIEVLYSPGKDSVRKQYWEVGSWSEILQHFQAWLPSLKSEMELPDKWAEAYRYAEEAKLQIEPVDNALFTAEEIRRIESAFVDFRRQLKEMKSLTDGQLRVVSAKLDYLMLKAKTLGKTDWKNIAMGAFVGLMIEQTIPPDAFKIMLNLLKLALGTIYQIPP